MPQPAVFPPASSSAKAVPPRRRSSPRACATARAARFSRAASSTRCRSSASCSPPTRRTSPTSRWSTAPRPPWRSPTFRGTARSAPLRIGQIDGQFVANPTIEQMFQSNLDLIYVGNEKDMLMIEGSADQLPEARFIEALEFAHQAIQPDHQGHQGTRRRRRQTQGGLPARHRQAPRPAPSSSASPARR